MLNLFAYGTLQLPEVMLAVTAQVPTSHPARLVGFSRHRLLGKSFPGIRPNPNASVDGLLFINIDAQTLNKLDAFEDDFYRREPVTVITAAGTEWPAQAYIVEESAYDLLLPEAWSLEDFKRQHLNRFLRHHE